MSHLAHLRTFLEAYRCGSFSRAAEQLGITQPAASLHIQSLEHFVGKPLFIRQARGVSATDAADELARSISPFIDGLEAKLASFRPGEAQGKTLYFIGSSDFVHYRFAATLARLMDQGYRIRFNIGTRQQIYEKLHQESVDFAITATPPDERLFGYSLLHTERMLLVHAPALTEMIGHHPTPDTLCNVPLIAFDEELPLVRNLWSMMFRSAPSLQASCTVPDMRIIRQMLIGGHGWSVLPDYHCEDALQEGLLVSPTHKELAPTSHLYLVWHKNRAGNSMTAAREVIMSSFPFPSKSEER
ncbi:LysR family transcriptional regulator [Pantoea sp. At-9b]|uniref:LysR family transcriptional regulator n=1 Tax=Pantoea sp. (strain At-9b) TaxID=592316 RepID=UPI0001B3E5DD|nr:LysR family transcriptional regulator [Pantoea sp. At-9b]ADU72880.1 transcriptional regulator, LysR family [Pantoea sp. At-9b]